jgi:LysM repeat protein
MCSARPFRASLWAVAALAPLLLCQCKTSPRTYKDVSYDPSKLKTPAGHGMERKDYPFDEQGNYRKDWVKSNATGRDRSASPGAVAASGTELASSASPTISGGGYPTYAQASAARSSAPAESAPPAGDSIAAAETAETAEAASGAVLLASAGETPSASVAPAASYHKVSSGDTLFGLASRYNTSVADLKRVNGLSGDSIRAGQSLRLP